MKFPDFLRIPVEGVMPEGHVNRVTKFLGLYVLTSVWC
jgi:hypothetical protein